MLLAVFLFAAFFSASVTGRCFADPIAFSTEPTANPLSVNAVGWTKDSTYFLTHVGPGKNITARYNGPELQMNSAGVSENTIITLKYQSGSTLISEKSYKELSSVGGGDRVLDAGSYFVTISYGSHSDTAAFTVAEPVVPTELIVKYDDKTEIAPWYKDRVTIKAEGFTVCDSQNGSFEPSFILTGNTKGVTKTLYFKSNSSGTIKDKSVGPVNFGAKAPTASIKIKDTTWKELQSDKGDIEYTNESRKAAIDGEDESDGSGINKKYYYITNKFYDSESSVKKNISSSNWKVYSSKVSLKENKLNYVYAKITDKAGNETYISSTGIWYDKKVPVVSGLTSSSTDSSASVSVKGSDEGSGIANYYCVLKKKGESAPGADSLKSGGKKSTDGAFDFTGLTAGTYTAYAIAEDKAGNLSSVKSLKITVGTEAAKEKLTTSSSKSASGTTASAGKSSVSSSSSPGGSGSSKKLGSSGGSVSKKAGSGSGSKKTGSSLNTKKDSSGKGNSASGNSLSKNKADKDDKNKASGNEVKDRPKKPETPEKTEEKKETSENKIEGQTQNLNTSNSKDSGKKSIKKEKKPVNIGRMLIVMAVFIAIAIFVGLRFRRKVQ